MLFPAIINAEVIDRIVAQVGDRTITRYDIEHYAPQRLREIYQLTHSEEKEALLGQYYNDVLNELIEYDIISIVAARMGIIVTDEEVDTMLINVSQQNIFFQQRLNKILSREKDITPEVRLLIKSHIIQAKLLPLIASRVVVTEADIADYLKDNNLMDIQSIQYDVLLGLFNDKDSYASYLDISKSGDFSSNVHQYGSLVKLGWVLPSDLIPVIAKKIPHMSEGDVSSPVEDDDGRILIAKVLGIRKGTEIPSDVYSRAFDAIYEEQMNMVFDIWLKGASDSVPVIKYI